MTAVWFEPTPIKNTTWTYRLRSLGHTVLQLVENIVYTVQSIHYHIIPSKNWFTVYLLIKSFPKLIFQLILKSWLTYTILLIFNTFLFRITTYTKRILGNNFDVIPLDSHLNQDLHMNINIHQSMHILCCYDSTYVDLDQIKFGSVGLYRYI